MKKNLKNFLIMLLSLLYLTACSTQGGFYRNNDAKHGEFSTVNTILLPVAVVGFVALGAALAQSGVGAGGYWEDPRWDYLRASGQWACRNAVDGQFLHLSKCSGQPVIDNWPDS